MHIRQRN